MLVGAAREGLLALSVGVGLGVLAELMEEEVEEAVGPKGLHDPSRIAVSPSREPSSPRLVCLEPSKPVCVAWEGAVG